MALPAAKAMGICNRKQLGGDVKIIKTISTEIFGLFIDDGSLAIAIVIWLAGAGIVIPHLIISPLFKGVILFIGLAVIPVESAIRRARR